MLAPIRRTSTSSIVYEGCWSAREPSIFATCSGDKSLALWDDRTSSQSIKRLDNAHEGEILSLDWNKYDNLQIATASVDRTVRVWDLRMLTVGRPLHLLRGHYRAVRKVRWSPWSATTLASSGYDMVVRRWELTSLNPMAGCWEGHTEFATGLDWSLRSKDLIASCAWDQSIHLLAPKHLGLLTKSI